MDTPQKNTGEVLRTAELTDQEIELIDVAKQFDFGFDTLQLAEALELSPEILEGVLEVLAEKRCLTRRPSGDDQPTRWSVMITNPTELARLKPLNNPENEATGHYTGRCMECESNNIWTDATAYGCNCCGALYMVGDMPPMVIENGTGQHLGSAW